MVHSVSAGHEVLQALTANEAQVIVTHPQVVHHCAFILSLFPAPQAEGQTTLLSQGPRGMDSF